MKKLYSPWRSKYINTISSKENMGCIFCNAVKSKNDKKNLIIARGKLSFVILNLFPYNNGHLMVVPNKHISEISEIDKLTILEMHSFQEKSIAALKKIFKPHGFNIGMNLGRAAGAGIEGHLHVHIVPRWNGDTNFMPVLGEVKVISEDLKITYNKLKKYLKA